MVHLDNTFKNFKNDKNFTRISDYLENKDNSFSLYLLNKGVDALYSHEYINVNRLAFLVFTFRYLSMKNSSFKKYLRQLERFEDFSTNKDLLETNSKGQLIHKRYIVYQFPKEKYIDRIYSSSSSGQRLSTNLCYFLFNDLYFDIDIKLSNMSLLLLYAKQKNIDSKLLILPSYVDKHEEFIRGVTQEFIETYYKPTENPNLYTIPKDDGSNTVRLVNIHFIKKLVRSLIKESFIITSNRKAAVNFFKSDIGYFETLPFIFKYTKILYKDIEIIRNELNKDVTAHLFKIKKYINEKELSPEKLKKYQIILQNTYCFSMESRILLKIFDECNLLNIKSIIPMFDGALILKEHFLDVEEEQNFVEKINILIKEQFPGIVFKHSPLTLKPLFDPLSDLLKYEDEFTTISKQVYEKMQEEMPVWSDKGLEQMPLIHRKDEKIEEIKPTRTEFYIQTFNEYEKKAQESIFNKMPKYKHYLDIAQEKFDFKKH